MALLHTSETLAILVDRGPGYTPWGWAIAWGVVCVFFFLVGIVLLISKQRVAALICMLFAVYAGAVAVEGAGVALVS